MEPLAEKAFLILKERFIQGFYMPNEKLSENQFCKEFNMSRTPVRQALGKFIEKGYITSIDKRGIFVKPISKKYCLDCRDLLIILEKSMTNLLAKNYKEIDFEYLQQCIDKQVIARETNNYYSYLYNHFEFRLKLFEHADNTALSNAYRQLAKDIIRIVMIVWRKTEDSPHYSLIEKDKEIINLLKKGEFQRIELICCDTYTFELDQSKINMYKSYLVSPDFVD